MELTVTGAIIEISDFSFSVGTIGILKNVTMTVDNGDYHAIIGPNGAGKSTLLKCLIRIYTGGTGSVVIDGRSLESYNQKDLARLMSYVPQSDGRSLDFTVYEFVMMGRYPYLSPFTSVGKRDREEVSRALELTETTEFAERHLNTLSGGERQNVFIAAAIAQGSQILLLDEPTTFLDPKHEADIHRTLKRVNRERGITILSVTHDINHAIILSDRITALKSGSVAFSGSPSAVMTNDLLERIYDKTFLFTSHPVTGQPVIVPEGIES